MCVCVCVRACILYLCIGTTSVLVLYGINKIDKYSSLPLRYEDSRFAEQEDWVAVEALRSQILNIF